MTPIAPRCFKIRPVGVLVIDPADSHINLTDGEVGGLLTEKIRFCTRCGGQCSDGLRLISLAQGLEQPHVDTGRNGSIYGGLELQIVNPIEKCLAKRESEGRGEIHMRPEVSTHRLWRSFEGVNQRASRLYQPLRRSNNVWLFFT
jgi:hypothetical protein